MVNSNEGIPNPSINSEETFSPNTHNILGTDSDTDQEEVVPNGYQPLPTTGDYNDDYNDDDADNDSETSDNETVISQEEYNENVSPITSAENDLLKELWSDSQAVVDINMDSEKVEEVKQAMVNITLPASAIPDWANNIPEEQWKQHLISRLNDLQKLAYS